MEAEYFRRLANAQTAVMNEVMVSGQAGGEIAALAEQVFLGDLENCGDAFELKLWSATAAG